MIYIVSQYKTASEKLWEALCQTLQYLVTSYLFLVEEEEARGVTCLS